MDKLPNAEGSIAPLVSDAVSAHTHTVPVKQAPAETERFPAERRLEALLDQLPYVILYETGGGREYISRNIKQLLGYDAEDLTATHGRFPALIHPTDNAALEERLAAWEADGRPGIFTAQFRVRKRSGQYVWLEDQIVAVDYPSGTQGMIGVMVDITQRHSAQARYKAIVEAADLSGIGLAIIVNRNGAPTILFINSAALAIGGRHADHVLGQPITQFIPPDEQPRILAAWERFLHHDLVHDSMEIDILHELGHRVAVSAGFSWIELDEEPAIIVFLRNISERRHTEQALIEARLEAEEISHIKSNILSNFSHELRTPLHSILGFSSLLAEEIKNKALREYALSIERSGQRLLATVTSIIEIAQLESGVGEKELYPMPIAEVLEAESLAFKPLVEERGIELHVDIPRRDLIVFIEKNRFRKAFEKILNNALKFTEHGEIRIELALEDGTSNIQQAVIRVRDTGIGMSPEFVRTAFEKFKQESSGFNRSYEGTGLGLPIARSYIRQINGTIDLSSEPGVGTLVTIRFPVVAKIGAGG